MDDLRSTVLNALSGAYEFERELGGGGMSRTYLMRETALQRRVVVKVLAPELLAGISVERFRREVLLAAQLQHPHVVPVLTAGDAGGIPWFTMPYVDGNSLRHRLHTGALPIGEAVGILRDVARALAYAHSQGIVHRDIKPDNVLLSAGSATVTDFGIAKAISAARTDGGQHGATLTQVGTSIGTPAYMAPEQAAGDPSTDHRADIYAFGVMAFEVLAGRTPFVASTPTRLLAAHLSEAPPELLSLRPDCPPALASLVMRCLAKEPGARPQHASELVQVLDTITSSGAGASVPEVLRGGHINLPRAIAIWAAATAAVSITAWAAREAIGLPDWVLPGAAGVMLAGLPVLLFTAYAQRTTHRVFTATPHRTPAPQGTMATLAIKASPHLSWRRTWMGGALAVGGFATLVVGFMVMRAMGIGPMASLQGRGAFGEQETLMIADFGSPRSDSTLGATVAEALRTDLAQSKSLTVITRSVIRDVLTLMQRSPDEPIPFDVAREIATREGAKAVLDGSIAQLGQSYVINARLVSALDGSDLATFREEAENEDDLLPALGRLTKSVRARAGESLKSIRASSELERVTTPSLPALRKYVEGSRIADESGEQEKGIALLREAVAIDTAFAMAWRKLAVLLGNQGSNREERLNAISTAFRHRGRLTEMERLLTEGYYYQNGPQPDLDKAIAAYEEAARLDSLSTSALNNAAVAHGRRNDFERAEALYRRVVNLPRGFGGAYTNLIQMQIRNRRSSAALDSTVNAFRERFPESNDLWEADWYAAWGKWDIDRADSIAKHISANPKTARQAIRSTLDLSFTSELRGRVSEALRLANKRSETLYRLERTPTNLVSFALDTAYYEAMYGERSAALAALDRALAQMKDIPPSERPWAPVNFIGWQLQDARIVREAIAGWERDQAAITSDPDGIRAAGGASLAFAESRWNDVVSLATTAEQRFGLSPREALAMRGLAYQAMGNADSAIASYERFLEQRDPLPDMDSNFRAQALKRLGELYEEKGDRKKAIDYYSQFAKQWERADPELQPQVTEVRRRIERLQRQIG